MDLYQVLTPVFSIITLLNLLSLKLAIKDNVTLTKIYEKKVGNHQQKKQNQEESPTKNTLKYMLLNFTPIQFFAVRRAKYKLSFFLAISIIIVATYFLQSPYAFAILGTVIYFTYFFIAMATSSSSTQQNQQIQQGSNIHRQKYMQTIFTIVSLVLNMIIIGKVFKNYQNTMLSSFMANVCINIALDNFIIRPIIIAVIALPLSRSTVIQAYIAQCQRQQSILQIYDKVGQKEMLLKPGKHFSPSKLAKNIPLEIEIEPIPMNEQFLKKRQQEGYERPIDILKKIKREKILPPINVNLQKIMDCQNSLNSLFNSTKKQQDSHVDEPIEEQKFEAKFEQQQPCEQLPIKKKFCSQNLIIVNPSQQQQVQNEEDIATQQIIEGKVNEQSGVSCAARKEQQSNKQQTINYEQQQRDPVKISLPSSQQPSSRQEPMRICINGQINLDFEEDQNDSEEIQTDNFRKRRQLVTLDQNSNKNTFGVLQIKEQRNQSQQIEEIDLNSPQKRRRHQMHVEYEEQSKVGVVKRKKKKFSHDNHHNRVIKFSTGQPYLQYLPNMLSKQNKGKKSQALSKKEAVVDSRGSNTVRRPKKRLAAVQNNENMVPEFRIEEL